MKRSALVLVLALVFLEWLDFTLYLYLAKSVFAKEFFPASNYSLLLSFALFAGAYFARPVGGWLFGREADLNGRRVPMVFSAALMGIATLGICILPSYSQIGIWATWGLLLLRIAQALAIGGEINTSAMFLVEHHPHKPLMAGGMVAASGALGMFVGGAFASILQTMNFHNAWRVVFAIVGSVSLWVCRLRKQLAESPEFQKSQPKEATPWQKHWRGLLNIAAMGTFVSVMVYICNIFWVSFAIDNQLMTKVQCAWIGSLAQFSSAMLALPIAYFSQPKHAYRLVQASMVVLIIAAPLLFYWTAYHDKIGVMLSLLGYVLANGLLCAALYYFLYLQLPSRYRCRGVSTVWALAASIGAISLPVAEQAKMAGAIWAPGLFVSIAAILCLTLLALSNQAKKPLSIFLRENPI
ncbi:MFS transporter [Legionella brunensis]|uniref:Proline/glycine betaine transporter-like protein n=1 Tax=Legionella brunensis TaxID=29422 RepID=A0A0W0SP58_9GAMM|nr:MFS transporter [Legionella brunensis]KTC85025.1 proline/glycine betaine transporter-like protein [Legionella brunensis]